jgi:hypothetical protein
MDVTDMLSELNDSGFNDSTDARKVLMINDALWDAAARQPWPFLETTLTLTFSGSSGVPTNLPANYRAAMSVVDVGNSRNKLGFTRLDDLDGSGTDFTQTGIPLLYYHVGSQLTLWPIPSVTANVRLRYIKKPAALTASTLSAAIEWPVEHHRVLVLGALYKLYDLEDDPELAVRFQGHYEGRLSQMVDEVFTRQYDRPETIGIDPWFDIDYD